jgi:ankyrin repeat protein
MSACNRALRYIAISTTLHTGIIASVMSGMACPTVAAGQLAVEARPFDAQSTTTPGPLIEAVEKGDESAITSLLANGADVGTRDQWGCTLLAIASRAGRHRLVELLLENGADVQATCRSGETSLHVAAGGGHLDIVRTLLKRRAAVDIRIGSTRLTPFLVAAAAGSVPVMKELLSAGANRDVTAWDFSSALYQAAAKGRLEAVQFLLGEGYSPDARGERYRGTTALMSSISLNGSEALAVTAALVRAGADVNTRNGDDETAMTFAIRYHRADVVRIITDAGADITATNRFGVTPLIMAADLGAAQIISHLIHAGAKMDVRDVTGYTPLMWAAFKGHLEAVKALVEAGADINARNGRWTALGMARQPHLDKTGPVVAVIPGLPGRQMLPIDNDEVVRYLEQKGAKD